MTPSSYSLPQRLLHWTIAALVFFNLVLPDGMNQWYRLVERGQTPTAEDVATANIHAYVGVAILILAAIRLVIRARVGVPPAPASQPRIIHLLAKLAHGLLYTLIFVMPPSGIAAYYLGSFSIGNLHAGVFKALFWGAIAAHVVGALAQHFYFRTNVLRRMTIG